MNDLAQKHSRGKLTTEEIYSQPDALRKALDIVSRESEQIGDFMYRHEYEQLILTGCGSTYYLSLAAAAVFRQLIGCQAIGLPASEIWLYSSSSYPSKGKKLLIAVSRSGATTETIRACEAFKKHHEGEVITLSCYEDHPLAKLGDLNLVFPSGQEQSIAQTRAFSTLYLATISIAAIHSDAKNVLANLMEVPDACDNLLAKHTPRIKNLSSNTGFDRYYFLGSGIRYGLACELSLKMKEMALCHSEAFHFFEFRHGPKSMTTNSTLIIGLLSSENHTLESDVVYEMQEIGARCLTIGEGEAEISFASQFDPCSASLLYLPLGQVLALNRSITNGLNPDLPRNLDAVVRILPTSE
jgi:glucosamine--fructose-6-phosphate aminotransferase (isomerizing)